MVKRQLFKRSEEDSEETELSRNSRLSTTERPAESASTTKRHTVFQQIMAIVALTLFHSANAVLSQGATRAFGGELCAHCGSGALGTCPRRFVGLRSYSGPQTQQLMKEVTLLRDNPKRNANRKTKVNGHPLLSCWEAEARYFCFKARPFSYES